MSHETESIVRKSTDTCLAIFQIQILTYLKFPLENAIVF